LEFSLQLQFMKRILMPTLSCIVAGLLGLLFAAIDAAADSIPPGAAALGYTKCIINEHPDVNDIAPGPSGNYKWFSGQWWYASKAPSLDHYSMNDDGILTLSPGGDLTSTPLDFSKGGLPLLPGKTGFYVEFDVQLSSNNSDHWPAVWLMPREHNSHKDDRYPGDYPDDPPGFERWLEIDVDEGGFGPGLTGTVHAGEGISPDYKNPQNPNNISKDPIDRSELHTFGASYDPINSRVTWWVDGVEQMSADNTDDTYIPAVARQQNFYLIMSNQSHGERRHYSLFISGVRAYVPPPRPPSKPAVSPPTAPPPAVSKPAASPPSASPPTVSKPAAPKQISPMPTDLPPPVLPPN
jgi:hypothetical protein